MKILKWLVVLSGFGLLAGGAYLYTKDQVKKLLNYCYRLRKFRVVKITKDNFMFTFELHIKNMSDTTVNIKGYDLDLYLQGKKTANIKSEADVLWRAKQIAIIPMTVDVNPEKAFSLPEIISLVALFGIDKSKIEVTIKGKVSAGLGLLSLRNYPVEIKYSLKELLADNPEDPEMEQCKVG